MPTLAEQIEAVKQQAEAWHSEYFERLLSQVGNICKTRPVLPKVQYRDSVFSACGTFNYEDNVTTYSVPYLLCHCREYEEIVAHEVCHCFHYAIWGRHNPHGKNFLYLLRDVCGFTSATPYHSFSPLAVERKAAQMGFKPKADVAFKKERTLAGMMRIHQQLRGKK